jgi:hypothetical protein
VNWPEDRAIARLAAGRIERESATVAPDDEERAGRRASAASKQPDDVIAFNADDPRKTELRRDRTTRGIVHVYLAYLGC